MVVIGAIMMLVRHPIRHRGIAPIVIWRTFKAITVHVAPVLALANACR